MSEAKPGEVSIERLRECVRLLTAQQVPAQKCLRCGERIYVIWPNVIADDFVCEMCEFDAR